VINAFGDLFALVNLGSLFLQKLVTALADVNDAGTLSAPS
jgi:hypothetical protein